jgi:hypothetical protein
MKRLSWILSFPFLFLASVQASTDLIMEDFEEPVSEESAAQPGNWLEGEWTFEGTAFEGYGLKFGTRINGKIARWYPGQLNQGKLRTQGHRGRSMLKSWGRRGSDVDGETGRALSPVFKIQRKFLRFLVSGGRYPGGTCLNLLIDDKIVNSVTGNNSIHLKPVAFEVGKWIGKDARIEVIDRETGAWGHLCVDQFVQTDFPKGARIVRTAKVGGGDVVWSGDDRLRGSLRWSGEELYVGDRRLDPASVRSLSLEVAQADSEPLSGSVVFRNGERWQCEIQSLAKGKLTIHGSLPGTRTVEVSSVHSLHFGPVPARNPQTAYRPGMLYRTTGSPVPGKIAWIKNDDLALDSALGILPIPRQGLLAYVFPNSPIKPTSSGLDEIGLRDGSLFFGKVRFEAGKVVLERSDQETLKVPWEKLHYLIRSGKETFWLNGLASSSMESHGPLGPGEGVLGMDYRRASEPSLFALRVLPKTRLSYRIPTGFPVGKTLLQTQLAPLPNSRGTVTFTLSVGGKEFYRKRFAPDSIPEKLSIPLPKGDELTVVVDFEERIVYPCGVDMHDAHLAVANTVKEGNPK